MNLLALRAVRVRARMSVLCVCAFSALAQQSPTTLVQTHASAAKLSFPRLPGCELATLTGTSFRDRACFEAAQVIGPSALLHAGLASSFALWRNAPHDDNGEGAFARRVEYFYARKSARASAEMLVGSLDREPLQPAISGRTGFWARSRTAMANVVVIRDATGWRPALSPLAGSLASGFVTLGCCGNRSTPANALERSAGTYAGYFAAAFFREFKPELKAYLLRRIHR